MKTENQAVFPESQTDHEVLLRAVLGVSTQAILCVNAGGQITLANVGAERIFGYSQEELSGAPVQMLLPERFRERHAQQMAAYLGKPVNRPMGQGLPLVGRRKDGSEFPADILLQVMGEENGGSVAVFVTDITQAESLRKLQELQAQRRGGEEQLKQFLEHAPVGIAICDAVSAIEFVLGARVSIGGRPVGAIAL